MGAVPNRSSKRALRLHHRLRMIEHARRVMAHRGFFADDNEWLNRWAVRHHDHVTSCSYWMCGNPRRHFGGPSVQERRRAAGDQTGPTED